ncbi:small ribosomal subunit protein bS21m [Trichomonascus vanleenenianus]|uniref:mitochondrial 37S ribosomal protein bS21m MRP21 n=1 Tax=Trichomonascus vanleenenianus TaxID=2268995 RepID=UPI003ECAD195
MFSSSRIGLLSRSFAFVRGYASKPSGKAPDALKSIIDVLETEAKFTPKLDLMKKANISRGEDLVSPQAVTRKIESKIRDIPVPRTGVRAGRSVIVNGPNGLNAALRNLQSINMANKVPRTLSLQRYHERPGKERRRRRIDAHKRRFDMGIKRLFKLVAEARRKGY